MEKETVEEWLEEINHEYRDIIDLELSEGIEYTDNLKKLVKLATEKAKEELIKLIKEYRNPYPKDIFLWDNKEKLHFHRGRFNKHCFKIVENIREDLIKMIEDE